MIFILLVHQALDSVRIFHEGLFWRCSFMVTFHDYSIWDLWIFNQPSSKVCQPHGLPREPYEHHSAIVFRTFWSIFLVTGVAGVVVGGFAVICAGPLTNHKLYKVGGVKTRYVGLCLLAVVLMYLMWVQVLDTLEQFALHQRLSSCPSFHLSVQQGPSFLLAPVAVFFCLLAGLLFILVGRHVHQTQLEKKSKRSEL
uniref:Transmembrane protein 182 n=1 Tax=Lates calcarifer TaxID=8187 RepID=A0A4W6D867_LATCA